MYRANYILLFSALLIFFIALNFSSIFRYGDDAFSKSQLGNVLRLPERVLRLPERPDDTNTMKEKNLKFCICFFGVVSRSIDKTIDSIKTNIFEVLDKNNISYDVYVHNMKVTNFTSSRSKDSVQNLEDKHDIIPYNFYSETDQKTFDDKFNWTQLSKYGYQENNYNTFQNSIRQLYSVREVTSMWKTSIYDYYIYLRPDLLYVNPLNISEIEENMSKEVLLTPYWGKFGGLNDRIYMGPKNVIQYLGNRFNEVLESVEKTNRTYHPERYMKYIVQKYDISIININLKAQRVRATGHIVDETKADPVF